MLVQIRSPLSVFESATETRENNITQNRPGKSVSDEDPQNSANNHYSNRIVVVSHYIINRWYIIILL